MSDFRELGEIGKKELKAAEELVPQKELEAKEIVLKSLEDQKQAFLQAKEAKKARAKANQDQPVQEQQNVLQAARAAVVENLPEKNKYPWNQLPKPLRLLMGQITVWHKVREETSAPLQRAIRELKASNTREEAADAMSRVIFAGLNYLEKNEGKMFRSARRQDQVKQLLNAMAEVLAKEDSSFYDSYASDYAHKTSRRANDFNELVESEMKKAAGLEEMHDVLELKRQVERDKAMFLEQNKGAVRKAARLRKKAGTAAERKAEYNSLRQKTPELTVDGYNIYERHKNAMHYADHPKYREIYRNAIRNYKYTGQGIFQSEAANLLRPVNFDKNENPISEEDRINHEWNLEVLDAYKRNDFNAQEDHIAEEYPHILDRMELPTHIKKEEFKSFREEKDEARKDVKRKILKERVLAWVDDLIRNGDPGAYARFLLLSESQRSLELLHPGVKKYVAENPGFSAKFEACDALAGLIIAFAQARYYVTMDDDPKVIDTSGMNEFGKKVDAEERESALNTKLEIFLGSLGEYYDVEHLIPGKYDAEKYKIKAAGEVKAVEEAKAAEEIKPVEEVKPVEEDKKEEEKPVEEAKPAEEVPSEKAEQPVEEVKKASAPDVKAEEEGNQPVEEEEQPVEEEEQPVEEKSRPKYLSAHERRVRKSAKNKAQKAAAEEEEEPAEEEVKPVVVEEAKPVEEEAKLVEEEEKLVEEEEKPVEEEAKPVEEEAKPVEEAEKREYKLNARQEAARKRAKNKGKRVAQASVAREELIAKTEEALARNNSRLKTGALAFQKDETAAAKAVLKNNITIRKEALSAAEKEKNAAALGRKIEKVTDERIRLRSALSIDIRKKTDYRTLMDLSDFAYMLGGNEEDLKKLIEDTAEARKLKKELNPKGTTATAYRGREGYPVLDFCLSKLLMIDTHKLNVSSDEAIVKNALKLEKLARGLEAFQRLLKEFGGEEYFSHLSEKKLAGFDGDLGQTALTQLDRLSQIAKYYRARKLIIEDENYRAAKGEIDSKADAKDDFEMKRLKELLRYSDAQTSVLGGLLSENKKTAKEFLEQMEPEEKKLHRLEEERYFVSPKWLKNSLSLTKLKDHNEDPNPSAVGSMISPNYGLYVLHKATKRNGKTAHHKVVTDIKEKLGGSFPSSLEFKGASDPLLKKITLSDNMNRTEYQIANSLSYRRTPEETREMMEAFTIQQTAEWKEIKKDPEAAAFYESYFKEMAMRHIASVYANAKRIENSIGSLVLIMHPLDLIMQFTQDLYVELLGANVAANIIEESNYPKIIQLFKENDKDGRYLFDEEDFNESSCVAAATQFKSVNNGTPLIRSAFDTKFDPFDVSQNTEMTSDDYRRMVFGTSKVEEKGEQIKQAEVQKLKLKAQNDPEAKAELERLEKVEAPYFFMKKHPKIYTMKNYLKRNDEGVRLVGPDMIDNMGTAFNETNTKGIKGALEHNRLRQIPDKEVDAYERTLKTRKLPPYLIEDDPYGLKLYKTKLGLLEEKDEKGNTVYDENEKPRLKTILDFKSVVDPVTRKITGDWE